MAIQQISRRLILNGAIDESKLDLNVETGETLTISRNSSIIFQITDTTPLTLSSQGGYSALRISPSTVPTSPGDGDFWLDSSSRILFEYRSSISKWLSFDTFKAVFTRTQGGKIRSTVALKIGEVSTDNSGAGFLVPRNATIVGISIMREVNTGAMDIEIRRDASAATLVTKTLANTVGTLTDNTLNVNVDSGSWLQAFCTNNSTNDATSVVVHIDLRYRG